MGYLELPGRELGAFIDRIDRDERASGSIAARERWTGKIDEARSHVWPAEVAPKQSKCAEQSWQTRYERGNYQGILKGIKKLMCYSPVPF